MTLHNDKEDLLRIMAASRRAIDSLSKFESANVLLVT